MPADQPEEKPDCTLQFPSLEVRRSKPACFGSDEEVLRVFFPFISPPVFRGLVDPSTANRRVRKETESARASLLQSLHVGSIGLHWIDNYAKCYAASSIYLNKELLRSMLWTAHGMKKLPAAVDMSWVANPAGLPLPALPHLPDLLKQQSLDAIFSHLASCDRLQYENSFSVVRKIVRIPLKPSAASEEEKIHLDLSSDGLRYFHPVDIYPENVVSSAGLLSVLSRLQQVEGFGIVGYQRFGFYSLLHADVAIFWQVLRLLYCYQ